MDILYSVFAADSQPVNGSQRLSLAYANEVELTRSTTFASVPAAVELHLTLYLAEFAKTRVFIHAGVVGWNGRAVLVPGRSLAGKSTLVMALLRAGATYYSDEFALVDRAGRIHPYPRPINLRTGDGSINIDSADLSAATGKTPLRAGLVLLTHYEKDTAWRPHRVTPGEALVALLTNTASAQRDPRQALHTIALMLAGARVLKGPRGDADSTVARLITAGQLPA